MGSPLATFYGSDRAPSAIGTRNDLVFHASATINNTQQVTTVPLSPIGAGIDLLRLPGAVGAYLSLKEAVVSTRKSPAFADKHFGACYQEQIITVPGNVTNQVQTFTFNSGNPTFFTRVGFAGYQSLATFTLVNLRVKEHFNASYYQTGYNVQPSTLNPVPLELNLLFDPQAGLINFNPGSVGFDLEYTFTNTAAGAVAFETIWYGGIYSFDWTQLLVQYVDWLGQPYNVGIFDDRAFSQPFGLGQKVPNPITNPNQTNFGSLQFTVLNSNSSFNNSYTYDVILNASLEYQLR